MVPSRIDIIGHNGSTGEHYEDSQQAIIRRAAERGLALALKEDIRFVDIFQHIIDELERMSWKQR